MSSVEHEQPGGAQPSAPPDAAGGEGWRRLDPRMLVVHPLREVLRLFPVLVGVLLAGTGTGNGGNWALIGTGVAIALGLARWYTTAFRVADGRVQVRRGVLQRQVVSVPLDRVRTVDISASAIYRVLGLVRVDVGTGLSDRKRDDALRLNGLSAVEAARLRAELLHRADVPTRAAAAGDRVLARAEPAWIRYAPFTLSGFVTAFVLVGFAWRIVSETHVDPLQLGAVVLASGVLAPLPRIVGGAIVLVVLLAVVSVFSTAGYVLSFWGFRLVRTVDGALQVTRGLVSTRSTTIEGRRLRGVEVSEPLLLRLVGGARDIGITTGLRVGRGSERGGTLLLPPASRAEARRVAAVVLGSADAVGAPLIAHGPAALRRRFTRLALVWVVVAAILVGLAWLAPVPSWTWELALPLLPLGAVLAYDRYRSLGHALAGPMLVTRLGSIVRRRSMIACDGIIGWNVERSFFQRRLGLATLTATTAAGRQGYQVQDLPLEEAVAFADRCVPGLLTPFLVSDEAPAS